MLRCVDLGIAGCSCVPIFDSNKRTPLSKEAHGVRPLCSGSVSRNPVVELRKSKRRQGVASVPRVLVVKRALGPMLLPGPERRMVLPWLSLELLARMLVGWMSWPSRMVV